MKNNFLIIKQPCYEHRRLDYVLSKLTVFSRSQIQKMIKNNQVVVNNQKVNCHYLLKINDCICFFEISKKNKIFSEPIPLKIIFEDRDLLVIDKPRGLVVHPGNGNHQHTLVHALLNYTNQLSNINPQRPGIVHRLDKNTSGLLIIAKNNFVHQLLVKQLANHQIKRQYQALVCGTINEDCGKIIAPIARSSINRIKMAVNIQNGKEAETFFKVIKRFKNATLVDVRLKQGRTHQIRVHFAYINHPIIGDDVYFNKKLKNNKIINDGQILHAYQISFLHPITKQKMFFKSSLPLYFKKAINLIKNF